jgi:predicted amidophosphoribosyltransferase
MEGGPGVCAQCRTTKPHFKQLRSWAVYEGPLRKALQRLKYKRDLALGEALARPLIELWPGLGWQVDLLLPVPLGVARLAERGYNQSALLARPLALAQRIPYRPQGLRRLRETRSQVELSAQERRIERERGLPGGGARGEREARAGGGRYRHQLRHAGRLRVGAAGGRGAGGGVFDAGAGWAEGAASLMLLHTWQ